MSRITIEIEYDEQDVKNVFAEEQAEAVRGTIWSRLALVLRARVQDALKGCAKDVSVSYDD